MLPAKKLYSLPNFLTQSGTHVPESGKFDSCPALIAAQPDTRQLKIWAYSSFEEWPKAEQFCPQRRPRKDVTSSCGAQVFSHY